MTGLARAWAWVKSWALSVDHKRIGIMYLVAVSFFFTVAGLLALGIRVELFTVGKTIMEPDTYNRVFTMHGLIMVFLFIIPSIPATMGNFLLPIMVGAKDVAFPRLNLLSLYIYVLGAGIALYSITTGGIDTGWTFYTPYSKETGTAVIAMALGAFVMGFSSILTGLNFIVTIHKMRAPGMTWNRLPLFLWSIYATSIVQILATPVIGITMILLVMERVLGIGIFDPALGGDPVLFQHFFWFYSHPAVYIMILPAFGVISELMGTFSRQRVYGYRAVALSSVAIALLGFLVWGHHMFTSGQSPVSSIVFSLITFLIGIPSGIKIFNWVWTMYRGSVWLKTPMLYALTFLFLFTIGGRDGHHGRRAGGRHPLARHLLRRRPLPLRDDGRDGDGIPGRHPLLVAQDDRPALQRDAGQGVGAVGVPGLQHDVLYPVHHGQPGHAAPGTTTTRTCRGSSRSTRRPPSAASCWAWACSSSSSTG